MVHVAPSGDAESGGQAAPAAHTPGPWRLDTRASCCVVSGDGRRGIASAGTYQDNTRVEATDAENLANANLICAAPDLLEALTALLACNEAEEGAEQDFSAALEAAHAALAKALAP